MKYIFLYLLFAWSAIAIAQDSPINTQTLNALLGTTRLRASEPINIDSSWVHFLANHSQYELQEVPNATHKQLIYQYAQQGIAVRTRKTGVAIASLDEFVASISIDTKPAAQQLLPYGCHSDMNCKAFKKQLKLLEFKYVKSASKTSDKTLRKEVFANETVTVALLYKKNVLQNITLIANLDAMYGGLLIK